MKANERRTTAAAAAYAGDDVFIVFVLEASPPIKEYDGCSLNSVNCSY